MLAAERSSKQPRASESKNIKAFFVMKPKLPVPASLHHRPPEYLQTLKRSEKETK
jgi:hypothetical protein